MEKEKTPGQIKKTESERGKYLKPKSLEKEKHKKDQKVQEASEESFPASDAPASY
jgi:hypothetical protein